MHRRGWGVLAASACLAACATTVAPQPDNSRAYANFLVGHVANLSRDYSSASDRYFEALVRSPHDESLIDGAITSALASGDVVRARAIARMAPQQASAAYVHLVRAVDALSAGRWSEARHETGRVEGAASEELAARMVFTWARTGEGHVDDVAGELQQLSAVRPYGGLFSFQQAMALDFSGRRADALQAYAAAEQGGLWLPAGVERHADLLMRTGARADAETLLRDETNAANPALAAALARLGGGGAVAPDALTPAKGAAIGLYGLAAIYLQESDTSNGLAVLTLSLMLDPDFDAARVAFAEMQDRLGHREESRAALQNVNAASPYSETARVMTAWSLLDDDRNDEAVALAQANAQTGGVRSRRALADMYRRLQRYSDAEPIYDDLIAGDGDDWRLYFARGVVRERMNRWPDAEADLQRALQIEPDQADVLNYLGYMWVDRGEHLEQGLAMIERAVEIRPTSGAVIDSLAWAYFKMGRYDEALEYAERAVSLDPADATLNDHLGDIYWRLNRRIEARYQWQRALALSPDDTAAVQAKVDHGLAPEPRVHQARQ